MCLQQVMLASTPFSISYLVYNTVVFYIKDSTSSEKLKSLIENYTKWKFGREIQTALNLLYLGRLVIMFRVIWFLA